MDGALAIAALSAIDGQLALDPARLAARCERGHPQATETVWRLLKGSATIKTPEPEDLSRRYAELLTENLGQPGFRELLLVIHDLDAHRDLVFGLVRDPYRRALFPPPGGVSSRRAEAHDLSTGMQSSFVADVLAASLSVPGVSDSRLVEFAPETYWRGETHRLIDRPAAFGRLLEEAGAAGAEQVVIVAATADPPGPHELRPPRLDGLGRVGEQIASAEDRGADATPSGICTIGSMACT